MGDNRISTPSTEELKRLVELATPGPWTESWDFKPMKRGEAPLIAHACGPQHYCRAGVRIGDSDSFVPDSETSEKMHADAALIALAPTLAAEVIALREEIDSAHGYKHQIATLHRCALEKSIAVCRAEAAERKLSEIAARAFNAELGSLENCRIVLEEVAALAKVTS